jgi:hypothetical protein
MRRSLVVLVACVGAVLGLPALAGIPWASGGSDASDASAATTSQQIGLKILLITDSTAVTTPSGIAYADWQNTLNREAVPFHSVVTNDASPGSTPLPALSRTLANGTQVANYEGVVVATSGLDGLSAAQWTTLQTFEHRFSVRQLTAYVVPSSDYGLSAPNPTGGEAMDSTTSVALTAAGAKVFPYLNKVSLDPCTNCTHGYEGKPLAGAKVDTLISGPGASSLLGIYTSSDGRQTMYQTFNQNQNLLQSELLRHGELAWLTRNTYFGDQRSYIEIDIDDAFTPDDAWNALTHSIDYSDADALRMHAGDVSTAATWEAGHDFRMDQLFNMGGSVDYALGHGDSDPLLATFQATCSSNCGPSNAAAGRPYANAFGWISNTYNTPYFDVGCATQNYIEAELNENTSVAAEAAGTTATGGGLGLIETTDPTVALGAENPDVFVPGNHSGFADLGNPATVDPPILETALTRQSASGGTLPAGTYEYAVADQFTNAAAAGLSEAGLSGPIDVAAGPPNQISISWPAICHASDYVIYRGYTATPDATTGFTWTRLAPAAAQDSVYGTVSTPFSATLPENGPTGSPIVANPASTTDVSGGGMAEQTYTDTGAATGTAIAAPPTAENAVESPWEQNPYFVPALESVGITAVGDDALKPYPNPPSATFTYGTTYTGADYPASATFLDGTAQVVPRHSINIFYNASTDYQELNEYQTLYGNGKLSACPTTCTWSDVIGQNVSTMFHFMMANDPRPTYVHQTNIMGTPPAGSEGAAELPPGSYVPQPSATPVTGGTPDEPAGTGNPTSVGDGTLYQVLDPLLYEYDEFFNSSAPYEQLTEQAIANLLAEQSAWANSSVVGGYVESNHVTVTNSGAGAIEIPLTGVASVGSSYAGSHSGWTGAPAGTSTYTALAAWPAEPVGPAIPTPPTGPAPGTSLKSKSTLTTVQVAPKTVHIKHGHYVTVSLKCEAPKRSVCSGTFTLKVSWRSVKHSFRIKAGKTARIAVRLPKHVKLPRKAHKATRGHHATRANKLHAKVVISTKQPTGRPRITRGKLTIER